MFRFSENTVRLLEKAGWHPNRSVDTTDIVARLRRAGYEVSGTIEGFLGEFGNLELRDDNNDIIAIIVFSRLDAWEHEVKPFREHLQMSLCPVANTLGSVVLMDTNGRVYDTDAASSFVLLGNSGAEAIDNLLQKKYLEKVLRSDEVHKIAFST